MQRFPCEMLAECAKEKKQRCEALLTVDYLKVGPLTGRRDQNGTNEVLSLSAIESLVDILKKLAYLLLRPHVLPLIVGH